jgi:hypothetical protein
MAQFALYSPPTATGRARSGKRFAAFTVTALMLMVSIVFASASSGCMTKNEARRHYPTAHLYWHGRGHCWDNRKGRKRYKDPVFSKLAGPLPVPAPDTLPTPFVQPVYRAMTFAPAIDTMLRFLPWEQRIAGSF